MKKLIIVIGTRPELIKTAPIIQRFSKLKLRDKLIVVNTAQHKDLLDPIWNVFKIKADYELDFMISGQNLSSLTARAIVQFQKFLDELGKENIIPVGIMAQGDTTTVMITSMLAFYNKIKFLHLEAGLRSFDLDNPFPEEYNRKVASIITSIHFAPTQLAKKNLIKEGVKNKNILVTGNTVIDALKYIISTKNHKNCLKNKLLKIIDDYQHLVLITCHRRENFGKNLINIIKAVKILANSYKKFCFIWTLHPNPNIKEVVLASGIDKIKNVYLLPPINYLELLRILSLCRVVLSDSGGIQEEAPSFSVPVLVLREKTERPEGVSIGIAHLVGADIDKIVNNFSSVLNKNAKIDVNPYGDGFSSINIVNYIIEIYFKE